MQSIRFLNRKSFSFFLIFFVEMFILTVCRSYGSADTRAMSYQQAKNSQSIVCLHDIYKNADGRLLLAKFKIVSCVQGDFSNSANIYADVTGFYNLLKLGMLYQIVTSGIEFDLFIQNKILAFKVKDITEVVRQESICFGNVPTREEFIRQDIIRIEALLKSHDGWDNWFEELAPVRNELRQRQKVSGVFLRKDRRLFHRLYFLDRKLDDLGSRPNNAYECLVSLNSYLKSKDIDLILVPIPFQEEVFAHRFSDNLPADGIAQPSNLRFMLDMLMADVEMIDLVPALQAADMRGLQDIYYNNIDHHLASGGLAVIAKEISRRLARYNFEKELPISFIKTEFFSPKRGYEHHRQLFTVQTVLDSDLKPLELNEKSKIYIVGDSNTRVPAMFGGPSSTQIAYQIARYLGVVPKLSTQIKSTKIMRGLIQNGREKLHSSKVVVFLFHYNSIYDAKPMLYSDWEYIDMEKALSAIK